jgi:hypothetical protein
MTRGIIRAGHAPDNNETPDVLKPIQSVPEYLLALFDIMRELSRFADVECDGVGKNPRSDGEAALIPQRESLETRNVRFVQKAANTEENLGRESGEM